jgi:hypothetical protein
MAGVLRAARRGGQGRFSASALAGGDRQRPRRLERVWTLPPGDLDARGAVVATGGLFPAAGTVLAALVACDRGTRASHLRATAAYHDDCKRFAVWQADHPGHFWPNRLANTRQGHLSRTTAEALGLTTPALIRRGEAARWLDAHDANLRFTKKD